MLREVVLPARMSACKPAIVRSSIWPMSVLSAWSPSADCACAAGPVATCVNKGVAAAANAVSRSAVRRFMRLVVLEAETSVSDVSISSPFPSTQRPDGRGYQGAAARTSAAVILSAAKDPLLVHLGARDGSF